MVPRCNNPHCQCPGCKCPENGCRCGPETEYELVVPKKGPFHSLLAPFKIVDAQGKTVLTLTSRRTSYFLPPLPLQEPLMAVFPSGKAPLQVHLV